MTALSDTLTALGFTADDQGKALAQEAAEAAGMTSNGSFEVQGYWTKGDLVAQLEQTQAPEDLGGYSALVTHPPVLRLSSPRGTTACNPADLALVETLVAEMG